MDVIPEKALDREQHRTLINALASISFAGLLGLVALPGDLEQRQLSIWFVLVSFLALLATLNVQGYKSRRWHDLTGDGLFESATLSLLASVIAFILDSGLTLSFQMACLFLAALVWASDFIFRIHFTIDFLDGKDQANEIR